MYEIEQKFIFDKLPQNELEFIRHTIVYRQYLSSDPEIRINRRVFDDGEERYNLTFKSENFLKRKEVKMRLSREQYFDIIDVNCCKDLVFEVWEYAIDEIHSISFKKCKNIDICFAEIEYADMEDYHKMQGKIKGYEFVKEEVTENERFYVKNIWRRFCEE